MVEALSRCSEDPLLAKYVVVSIAALVVGVVLAGLVHFFRYSASFNFQARNIGAFRIYQYLYLAAAYGSLGAFLVGLLIVLCGAWRVL
jgi:hypothetical protein